MDFLLESIESIIDRNPLQIARDKSLREAIFLMGKATDKATCVVVIENIQLVGLLAEKDALQWINQEINLETTTIDDILTRSLMTKLWRSPITIQLFQIQNLLQITQLFQQNHTHHLVILDSEDNFLGIITDANFYLLLNSINSVSDQEEKLSEVSLLNNNIDIKNIENLEPKLNTCENYLDTIINNISEGIVILNQSGEIIFANPSAGQMFGLSPPQLMGVSLGIPISLNDLFEMEIIRRNGEIGVGEVQVSQIIWDGNPCYFVSLRDITARKKADNELWQSQERYRLLAEAVPNLIWLTDSNGMLTEINEHTQEYFGKTLVEMQENSWLQMLHFDDLEMAEQVTLKAESLNQPYSIEYRLRQANGVYRWHLAQALPIWDELQQATIWLVSCTDIENIKQTELLVQQKAEQENLIKKITQRIRESLDLNEVLNTTVQEVRRVLQADRVLVYQVFAGGTGAAIAESVGDDWLNVLDIIFPTEVFPEENYERYAQGRIFALNDRENEPVLECLSEFLSEIQVKAKLVVPIVQNNKLWGLIIAHQCANTRQWQDQEINILRQIAIQLAIAIQQSELYEQLQSELKQRWQIEAERQKLDLVVENSSEFMGVADLEGQIIFLNRAGQKLVGIESKKNIQLLTLLDFFQPEDHSFIQNKMLPIVFREGHWEGEFNLWHFQTQNLIPVLCNIFLIKDPKTGQPTHLASVIRDITRIKQAEQDMFNALEKEKELSDLRSRFISMASHEFRTPLTIISSSTEIVETYHKRLSDEKKQQHFKRIKSSIKHMTELLEDVLTISRAEAEIHTFNPQPLDLLIFCRDLIAELQLSSHKQMIIFNIQENEEINSEQAFITPIDPKLLRQIFTNLLSNALKYSPAESTINFNFSVRESNLIFEVKDQGIGIPPEDLNQLFTAFHRAANTGNIQGTGLGLAIIKKCVDLHQGEIQVHSILNEGTSFIVSIPKFFPEK